MRAGFWLGLQPYLSCSPVGADEIARALVAALVIVVAAEAAAVHVLQDGEGKAAVLVADGGDAGGPVGLVGLVFPGGESGAEVAHVPDGVGLVAVGDDEILAHGADGVVNDEAGVGQLGGVIGLGADAVFRQGEDAVAAVLAAAHDEVIDPVLAHGDAAAGVAGVSQEFQKVDHVLFSFFSNANSFAFVIHALIARGALERRAWSARGLAQLASGCFCRGKATSKTIE